MLTKINLSKLLLCLLLVGAATLVYVIANDRVLLGTLKYFWDDIDVHDNRSLMLGSSSIARLNSEKYLPCSQWLNRGLGNSTIQDINRYLSFTPMSLNPPMILLYAGENDINNGMSVTDTLNDYQVLINRLLTKFPESSLHILGVKPSPSRKRYWHDFSRLNRELRHFIGRTQKVYFYSFPEVNDKIYHMLFNNDGIHLTDKGYVAFTSEINKQCINQ